MTYYPNNPADWTDGDWQMAALEERARVSLARRRAGICDHGWTGPKDGEPGTAICHHCGHVFGTLADRDRAMGFTR